MSAAAVPRLRALPLSLLGSTRQAAKEMRSPVIALTFAAPTAVFVVVVVAAAVVADGPRRGGREAPICARRVLNQVEVHQDSEGEAATSTSRRSIMEFSFPA
jgi:hypothetical protein